MLPHLRFTSHVTSADFLLASMAAKSFWSVYLSTCITSIGGTWSGDWVCALTVWAMLAQLSLVYRHTFFFTTLQNAVNKSYWYSTMWLSFGISFKNVWLVICHIRYRAVRYMGNLLRISPIDLKTHNGKVNIYTMSVVGSAMDEEETLFSMWNEIAC